METRVEAAEVVGSLSTLSTFYTDNSPAARRWLRSTIESQGVRVNEEFLEAAQGVLQVGAASTVAPPVASLCMLCVCAGDCSLASPRLLCAASH